LLFAKQDSSYIFIPAFHVAALVGAGSAIVAGVFAATLIRE
jgi:fructose-1-phosphate kinase PfkB-like protein